MVKRVNNQPIPHYFFETDKGTIQRIIQVENHLRKFEEGPC